MGDSQEHWSRYYRAVEGRPPRQTLLRALDAFEAEGTIPGLAVDLGAGTGRDSLEMLRRGWHVLAIDGQAEALATLERKAGKPARLQTLTARFERLDHLPSCLLINASFSLPFCSPLVFARLWGMIGAALQPGGRFAGQLLGPEDDWAKSSGVTSFSREALKALLEDYAIEVCEEERRQGFTAKGRAKHWHLYHLVLQREQKPAATARVAGIISEG